jgi:bifunctional DNA-binding transcriptional regulator/antitoxin component of YhaV-PrlF toxin-antitoxin module
MPATYNLQLSQRGVLVLPKALRENYNLQPGDSFTLLDLGEGVLVLKRGRSEIDLIADRIKQMMLEEGVTLESMLLTLREERERYAAGD